MARLIRWLIFGDAHMHVWEDIESGNITRHNDRVVGAIVYMKCKVCGNYKVFRAGLRNI